MIHPTGWVYQICPRPVSGLSCPSGSSTVSPYGGTRLALQQGDTLKIRFVNRLPKLDPNKLRHVVDPGQANLYLNPTNLHTHGLLTPARAATRNDPTFGDYVFVTLESLMTQLDTAKLSAFQPTRIPTCIGYGSHPRAPSRLHSSPGGLVYSLCRLSMVNIAI